MQLEPLLACIGVAQQRRQMWAGVLPEALHAAEITGRMRVAAWLSQTGHESGRYRYTREIWGPTKAQLRYEPGTSLAKMLGNTHPGDGKRYMGRGLIQTTGRANYAATSRKLRELAGDGAPDLLEHPEALEQPRWAALSAAIYWRDRKLNQWADVGDVYTLTRRINGGTNGLAERHTLYSKVLSELIRNGW